MTRHWRSGGHHRFLEGQALAFHLLRHVAGLRCGRVGLGFLGRAALVIDRDRGCAGAGGVAVTVAASVDGLRSGRQTRQTEKTDADDDGKLAAMLALHLPNKYLDQLFVAPEYQGRNLGRQLLAFTRRQLADEIELRCVRENEKAWRWYEREGFVCEKEQVEPMTGFVMKYYRWKKQGMNR